LNRTPIPAYIDRILVRSCILPDPAVHQSTGAATMHKHLGEAAIPLRTLLLRSLPLLLPFAMLAGCATNRPASGPESQRSPAPPDYSNGETLGEKLGRLDAQMKTAPADSLDILKAEYQRLVAEAAGPGADTAALNARPEREPALEQEQVATGDPAPETSTPLASMPPGDTTGKRSSDPLSPTGPDGSVTSTPRRSPATGPASGLPDDSGTLPPQGFTSTPRRFDSTRSWQAETSADLDPLEFRGLRESEKRTIPGYRPPARVRSASSTRPGVASAPRTVAPKRTGTPRTLASSDRGRSAAGAPTSRQSAARQQLRSSERDVVEGIAAQRAGKYPEATRRLAKARANVRTPEARYSYAVSLEKTGNLGQAAGEYLSLSGSGGSLSHKAYISYCRVLSRQGQRGRARELVQRFIRQNPDSSQVGSARRLLQTL
jgi:hypothetical protein